MRYQTTAADRAPAPASYQTERRYLGYKDADYAQPYAKFFSSTVATVQDHVIEAAALGHFPAEFGYSIDDAARRMSRPGYESMETGYTRLADGRVLVSVLTRMPGVTAEMWDWWFGWHGTETARYKLWHPEAHYYSGMGEDRSSNRSLTDKERYIGNVSYVDEYLGADASPLTVRFIAPTELGFDDPKPGSTIIAARGGFSTLPISFAWLIHQIRPTDEGCEMRSRFFVNDLQILRLPAASVTSVKGRVLAGPIGRAVEPLARRFGGVKADQFGPAMVMHCAQEMNHLARFLPELHAEFRNTP